ncbi:MAG TPA: YigZ family protein [Xanthomonadales bacterium]|nr:YigZ family protein [Xanthomonadales bacterium]
MARFALTASASHETVVKHSRFVAHAAPVTSAELALAFRDRISDPGATHNCWAYRLGDLYRFSDDGEPGGSAGRPILAAIDGQDVDRVMVVVTRWYGGIKLGAGGLVRAYGRAAAECLRTAPRVAIVARIALAVRCGFADAGVVRNVAAAHGGTCEGEAFDAEGVVLQVELPATSKGAFEVAVRDATRGKAAIAMS